MKSFKKTKSLAHKSQQNLDKKHILKYSYEGKLEKNRKKRIYITRLRKKYFRYLKEYQKNSIKKGYYESESGNISFSDPDTKYSSFLNNQISNESYNKNKLFLKRSLEGTHCLKEKRTETISPKEKVLTVKEKYKKEKKRPIDERYRKYKIMTQVTKKGQPKLNKRIGLLLDKIKEIVKK
ncbi:hypothetical protein PORY_000215 [Pneumocystis oryctolagi]|uniref:Uncharacterized protein n=1 Tax=Pneumocystis oryctolagi TaxID=42067 RepID=A0ACB7CEL1_9ASCO|nr:hypothetical protein PORY_000215 [Pneumocystis oryctolagi]